MALVREGRRRIESGVEGIRDSLHGSVSEVGSDGLPNCSGCLLTRRVEATQIPDGCYEIASVRAGDLRLEVITVGWLVPHGHGQTHKDRREEGVDISVVHLGVVGQATLQRHKHRHHVDKTTHFPAEDKV